MANQPPEFTSPSWDNSTKIIVALVSFALISLLLIRINDIYALIIIALVVAYLLRPLVHLSERLLGFLPAGQRPLAVLMTFILTILLLLLVILVIAPPLFQQIQSFWNDLPGLLANFEGRVTDILSHPLSFGGEPILFEGEPLVPIEQIRALTGVESLGELFMIENVDLAAALQTLLGSMSGLTGPFLNLFGSAFAVGVNLTLLLVMLFYLMKDGDKFVGHIVHVVPTDYQGDARRMFYELGTIWNAYLRGQLLLCLVVGVATFLVATALGLPNALILGLIAGILEFIPNLGPLLAMIPAVFLALISTSTTLPFLSGVGLAIAVIIAYFLIQQIEAIFLVPRIMGDNLDLHPFVVIVGVLAGASLAGAIGVILAAPFIATGRLILQYIYAKLRDREPFQEGPRRRRPGDVMLVRAVRGSGHLARRWRGRSPASE